MRVIRRRGLLGVVVVAAVSFAAACGGGDGNGDSGSLSTEEFVEQVDAVCRDAEMGLDAIPEPQSAEEFEPALAAAVPLQQAQADELRAIEPPDELSAQYDEAVALIDSQVAVTQQALDDLQSGADPNQVVADLGPELDRNEERLDELAEELGLMECGSDAVDGNNDTDTDTTTDGTLTDPTDTDATSVATTGGTGDVQQYLTDVGAASQALVSFGEILQTVTSPAELEAQAPEAQAQLDEFDAAIAELDGYTLDDAQLEEQRAGIVATAPEVSDVLRRFVDAAASGDLDAVQALLPEVTTALTDFQAAANAGATP